MANQCRSCKRDIAPGQTSCHVCGAQQSFVRYHFRSGVSIIVIVSLVAGVGYWYLEQSIQRIESNRAQVAAAKTEAANQTVEELESQLELANAKLQQAQADIEKANNEQAKGQTDISQIKQQLEASLTQAEEAEKRAGWLSKVNRQLKDQVEELTLQLAAVQKKSATVAAETSTTNSPPLVSLKQQLANLESQKQTLIQQIASKKLQMEQSWKQSDGSTQPSNADLAAREQQLTNATQAEQEQINALTTQIDTLVNQIRVAESASQ